MGITGVNFVYKGMSNVGYKIITTNVIFEYTYEYMTQQNNYRCHIHDIWVYK